MRIHSGRFNAFTAHRKAIGGPAVALLQPNCSTARLWHADSGMHWPCPGEFRKDMWPRSGPRVAKGPPFAVVLLAVFYRWCAKP